LTDNRIALSQKQSNAWFFLSDREHREIIYGGAAGGGKSMLGCLWHINNRLQYPESRGLIGRATLKALKDSTMVTFFRVCNELGYKSGSEYKYNAQDNVVKWANGSVTLFKDLEYYPSDPDFTSLGSTEFTDAFIDEVTDITERAFEIVTTRIRWNLDKYGIVPKVLATCNPSPGWTKKRYISDDEGKPVVLKPHQKVVFASLLDNPDKAFVELYRSQLESITDEYDRRRLLFGDWDVKRAALRPFATQFDRSKHVSETSTFQRTKLIYISFDFNLDPFGFIFQHKWLDKEGYHHHIFDEGTIPDASLDDGIDQIMQTYGVFRHNFIITGDKMGDRRDMGQRDKSSYYQRIRRGLKLHQNQIETHPNPTHENSRDDVNYYLHHYPDFKIHPKCRHTISDMMSVEVDSYGKILKANRKNESQKADHLDCVRYSINDRFSQQWIRSHQKK
jgi:hypothetical protein